jgi:hypothetical protein
MTGPLFCLTKCLATKHPNRLLVIERKNSFSRLNEKTRSVDLTKKRVQSIKQRKGLWPDQSQDVSAGPLKPISPRCRQASVLGSPGKGIDDVEHRATLLQVKSLLNDLGLLLADLKLPGEGIDGAFGVVHL